MTWYLRSLADGDTHRAPGVRPDGIVVAYQDNAEAVMPEDDPPVRITDIWLWSRITVCAPATEDAVRHLAEVAHRECFIANSLHSRVVVDPVITIVAPR
ncbi:MAG: hypothetical protein M3460_19110 [Actinomycetota bacterium]|nr:hypothetical protein [Actinomycetota bacterium]